MSLTWLISLRARSAGVSGVLIVGVVFLAAPRGNKAGLGFYREIFFIFFASSNCRNTSGSPVPSGHG